jgi:glycolate oxidase iron-sulfur subunit
MDVWQREVHFATQRVLEAAGFGVTPTGDQASCCGALHTHAGLVNRGEQLTQQVDAALDPSIPIIVNSAGCGAHLKQHSSHQVFDAQEFLAQHLDRLPEVTPLEMTVAVQDPCHLRHVQRAHLPTRALLKRFVNTVSELDDDGLCCGAGGAYSILQPKMALQVRDRKVASITRAAPDVVASANPGCSMHLAAGGVTIEHPMVIIDNALRAG